jgi:methylenetetrahydrofolate reductase (NADPH)
MPIFEPRNTGRSGAETWSYAHLLANATFEILPMQSAAEAVVALPPNSRVSVTASPAKGMSATLSLANELRACGHRAVPHVSARLVRDRADLQHLVDQLAEADLSEIFVVGGDVAQPIGAYSDAASLLRELLALDHHITRIGIPAYPDGHASIAGTELRRALIVKQSLLADGGIAGWATTQMCFDTRQVTNWIREERVAGLKLPIHLGLAGVVSRARLLSIGTRIGVGTSIRFLRKNRHAARRLLVSAEYSPDELLQDSVDELRELGVDGLHFFTFNQVRQTEDWRMAQLAQLERSL